MCLKNAMIPVYDDRNPDKAGFRFQSDDALLCIAINHLYETQPEKFGESSTRAKIRVAIEHYLKSPDARDPFGAPQILPFLGDLFASHGVNPFADIRLACLGGSDMLSHSIFGDDTADLRKMFQKFRDFNPHRTQAITAANSGNVLTCGKYHYILTGNVLNDPRVENVKSVFAACANMAAPGGVAIHGIGYSNHHYNLILNRAFHNVCGQARIDEFDLKRHGNEDRGFVFDAIIMQQRKDVELKDPYLDQLERRDIIPHAYNAESPPNP